VTAADQRAAALALEALLDVKRTTSNGGQSYHYSHIPYNLTDVDTALMRLRAATPAPVCRHDGDVGCPACDPDFARELGVRAPEAPSFGTIAVDSVTPAQPAAPSALPPLVGPDLSCYSTAWHDSAVSRGREWERLCREERAARERERAEGAGMYARMKFWRERAEHGNVLLAEMAGERDEARTCAEVRADALKAAGIPWSRLPWKVRA